MPSSEPAARAAELRGLLSGWSHEYYVLDAPTVDDATFDLHFDELVELEREHPELAHARLADAARRRARRRSGSGRSST